MEPATYARFVLALAFVIGLILVIAWAMRRFGFAGRFAPNTARKERRLHVVEVAPVDGRQKLVMVRRDHVEHLLILGQGDPVVVERNIAATADLDNPAAGAVSDTDFKAHLKAEEPE